MVAVLQQKRSAFSSSTGSHHDSGERVPVSADLEGLRYSCSVCHAPLHRDAATCMVCSARTAGVQCGHCRFVGPPHVFESHRCPSCGIAPAPVDGEAAYTVETDPIDKRPLKPWHFASRYSHWLDVRGLFALFVVAGLFLFLVPAFAAALGWGYLSEALKWASLFAGAGIAFYGLREIIWAKAYPTRVIFYVAVALAVIIVVLGAAYPVR